MSVSILQWLAFFFPPLVVLGGTVLVVLAGPERALGRRQREFMLVPLVMAAVFAGLTLMWPPLLLLPGFLVLAAGLAGAAGFTVFLVLYFIRSSLRYSVFRSMPRI